MKKLFLFGFIAFFALFILVVGATWQIASRVETFSTFDESTSNAQFADVNGHKITLETVSSSEDITRGLGGRDRLASDHGMLFLLGLGTHSFWMKDMRFPIDIIWIRDDVVVEIAPNVPAPKTSLEIPAIHTPKVESDSVLEINAGLAKTFGLKVGSVLTVY